MTPAGWYRDPYGAPGLLRWWDGREWTQATQPGDEESSPGNADPPPPPGQDDRPGAGAAAEPETGARPDTFFGAQTQAWAPEPGKQAWAPPGQAPGAQVPGAPQWPGSQTPGWAPAGQAWGTPQPWGSAPAPGGGHRTRTTLLIGGGVLAVVAVIVVVALVATGVFGGGKNGRSPVTSTITDPQAGISYAGLGGGWRPETVSPTGGLGKLGFHQGQSIVVMTNYQNGQPYLASSYSGTVADTAPGSLQSKASAVVTALEPVAYPPHTRHELSSEAHNVGGHAGWLLKVRFDFPQAKSSGWNFRTETAAVVIIDRGSGQPPAEFYVSIPDSHKKQGDLDLLLSSLKVS